ncbi:hypothetical protein PM082_015797 [Marasmius tenuissimus]|nr:hypothetical protein PM082_015797 [Marasmius tenuissimus]
MVHVDPHRRYSSRALLPYFTSPGGVKIPSVGMGCWIGLPGGGQRVYDYCSKAIKHGYRHFDTAARYDNEGQVGRAIRDSGIPREEFFITTKLSNFDHARVREAFEESLNSIGCDYIDLYLMHWPQANKPSDEILGDASDAWEAYGADESPTFSETWRDMEDLMNTGKIRAIGVSNFSIKNLEILLPQCRILPATNQVESHPYLPNHELKAYCDAKGISMTCYSPLGQQHPSEPNSLLGNPIVASIAAKHNIDVAQVLISWGVRRGTIVIPKTENEKRMVTNITLKHLPEEDMISLNELHKRPGCHRSLWKGHSPSGKALGWTYEQLGWNMAVGGIVPSS